MFKVIFIVEIAAVLVAMLIFSWSISKKTESEINVLKLPASKKVKVCRIIMVIIICLQVASIILETVYMEIYMKYFDQIRIFDRGIICALGIMVSVTCILQIYDRNQEKKRKKNE